MELIDEIFSSSDSVRYVAIYRQGELVMRSRSGTLDASSEESDRYEELLVNPTLIKLATQRGEIDCGGLEHLLIKYGNFYQFVLPTDWGHVSVCIESEAHPIEIGLGIRELVGNESR